MKIQSLIFTLIACGTLHATAQTGVPGPHLLVYKTKKDYSKRVPVILSDDKTRIISYPDPADIRKKGKSQAPTSLHGRYLMDNTGIGINTAYLNMTCTHYAKLKNAPAIKNLNKMILERNPLTTLYDCGLKSAYKNPATEINSIIDKKLLEKNCKLIPLVK